MSEKAEKAKALFLEGYNCSQAVVGAFADEIGLDFNVAIKLASSFGGGMGRLREVCGAVSGMFMVAGLLYGYDSPDDINAKSEHYKLIQDLAEQFREKNGHIVCRELLGLGSGKSEHTPEARTEHYYKKRPCGEYVYDAAEILYEFIKSNDK